MEKNDGNSNGLLDIIYLKELKEKGTCDVMELINEVKKFAKDFDFDVCT
jgi:hypothetical protein